MQWRLKTTTGKPTPAKTPAPASKAADRAPPQKQEKKASKSSKKKRARLSRLQKPANLSLEDWQIELRRQFGREQKYKLRNLTDEPVFSEFEVLNPQTGGNYRVQVRGARPGDNFCTCPDFATNTLGTCKHIEFTLARLERKPGARALLRDGYRPPHSEVYLHYGAQREVRFRAGTDCPVELARLAAKFFGADGALLPDAFARFDDFVTRAADFEGELRCGDDALAFIAEVRDAEQRRRAVAEAFPRGPRSAAFKDLIQVNLYDYQREGCLFAARAGRCLLGDEMGLGKTVQSIAAAEVMARLYGVERVLVICPTSLKHQWEREIERLVGRPTVVVNGLRPRRERHFAQKSFYKVMNYDTVHADLDLIAAWAPDLVILDEAQRIKNWTTRVARSVKRIASPYALVLTGTPLENRLEELISIVQFVDRFRLGPTFRLLHEHQVRDEFGKVIGYRHLDRIGQTLEPVLLRRQKEQVLDQLPERIESSIFVPMTELQRKYHTENMELVARIVERWRRLGFLTESDQRKLMVALQRMRMACDSSYLVDHHSDHGKKADEAMTVLEECLERPGTKVVVFSQWLRMHELLERRIRERGWGHVKFHGGVPSGKRKGLIDQFRDDPNCRIFLSTDAGGVGLNLQQASVVLNMDLPWNPAVLEQRIGRVHRLGQGRPVRVVHFIAQGTIEDGMQNILKFKKSLFSGVLDDGEKDVFLGGSRLNRFMEQVEAATSAIPEEMLEDAEGALLMPPVEDGGAAGQSAGGGGKSRGRQRRVAARAPMAPPGMEEESPTEAAATAPAADPWSSLMQVGMALWGQLSGASKNGTAAQAVQAAAAPLKSLVQRDEKTGETFVKLPVPPAEILDKALKALGGFLESLRK